VPVESAAAPAKRTRTAPASYAATDDVRRRPTASDFVTPKAAECAVSEAEALGAGAAPGTARRIFDFTRARPPPRAPCGR
jgi:hypothetical protein